MRTNSPTDDPCPQCSKFHFTDMPCTLAAPGVTMRKRKRKYAAVGERVTIVTPKEFIRCGYPLSYDVLMSTRKDEVERRIRSAAEAIGALPPKSHVDRYPVDLVPIDFGEVLTNPKTPLRELLPSKVYYNLEFAVCSTIMRAEGWGGNSRSIYEEEADPVLVGKAGVVKVKRIVKTGTRYQGGGSWSYEGEYDYDPTTLEDQKTHCVYTLELDEPRLYDRYYEFTMGRCKSDGFQILAEHCTL